MIPLRQLCEKSNTVNLVKLPIDVGIEPVNWLAYICTFDSNVK